MEEDIWYFRHDLLTESPEHLLKTILEDDKAIYNKAEEELKDSILLLDKALVLYIESIQAAYRIKDKWEKNNQFRASIAMLVSNLNYILLSRHGILLGYYPEVKDLLRSCYERISRCYLFFYNKVYTEKFLSGEEIWQKDVDKALSKLEKDNDKNSILLDNLRKYYKEISKFAHPNLESFRSRYGDKNLSEKVGLDCTIGGIMSSVRGHLVIMILLKSVLEALHFLRVMFPEKSGEWDKKCIAIEKMNNSVIDDFLHKHN